MFQVLVLIRICAQTFNRSGTCTCLGRLWSFRTLIVYVYIQECTSWTNLSYFHFPHGRCLQDLPAPIRECVSESISKRAQIIRWGKIAQQCISSFFHNLVSTSQLKLFSFLLKGLVPVPVNTKDQGRQERTRLQRRDETRHSLVQNEAIPC